MTGSSARLNKETVPKKLMGLTGKTHLKSNSFVLFALTFAHWPTPVSRRITHKIERIIWQEIHDSKINYYTNNPLKDKDKFIQNPKLRSYRHILSSLTIVQRT